MSVIHFPNPIPPAGYPILSYRNRINKLLRDFALNIAVQLRNDPGLNKQAPYLVNKVILLLMKES